MGFWSISITLSMCSSPFIFLCGSGRRRLLFSLCAAAGYSVPLTSVDLPEPETPVTQMNRPIGKSTSTESRLFPRAPLIDSAFFLSTGVRSRGIFIERRPLKYWPVSDVGFLRIVSGGPCATT